MHQAMSEQVRHLKIAKIDYLKIVDIVLQVNLKTHACIWAWACLDLTNATYVYQVVKNDF